MKQGNKIFLSDDINETGSLAWFVADWNPAKPRHNNKESEVQIRDCYKQVVLDFGYSNVEEYKARLAKIDTLISELESFRDVLKDSWG